MLVVIIYIKRAKLDYLTSHQLRSNSVKCLFICIRFIIVAKPRSDMFTFTRASFFSGFNLNDDNNSSQQVELIFKSINLSSSR